MGKIQYKVCMQRGWQVFARLLLPISGKTETAGLDLKILFLTFVKVIGHEGVDN